MSANASRSPTDLQAPSRNRAKLPELRQLLAQRFPAAVRQPTSVLPTGWPGLDEAAGGLPKGGLTEIICASPSCGSQLLFGQLLRQTRALNLRVALVDAHDAFDPCSWPADWLEHLVWVRAQNISAALQVADLFARDANLGLVALDLRHAADRDLRRIPASQWYRLQRAVEQSSAPFLVQTPAACVPSAQLRILLEQPHTTETRTDSRAALIGRLPFVPLRQRRHAALG
jgi:hypothetical protein